MNRERIHARAAAMAAALGLLLLAGAPAKPQRLLWLGLDSAPEGRL